MLPQPLPDAFIFKLLTTTPWCFHLQTTYNLKKGATYTATQSGMRITFRSTEWGIFDHPCKKHQINGKKRKKAQKSAKKLERKYDGTDDCIIDVRNLYPAPLLQIFSKKLKLKLQGTCLKESAPRDIEKGTQSKLIPSLYVQRMYKFWKWIKISIRYDLGDYDMTYPKTCPSISCWQISRWSKPPRWSNLLQLTSRYP